jgi:hypothetical protein
VLEGVGGCGGSDAGGEEERARALHVTAGFGEAMQVTESDASHRERCKSPSRRGAGRR